MALLGRGAGRLISARGLAKARRKRKLPWKKTGLSRAERVTAFLEFLPITKGPLAGRRMRLLPEQRQFVHEMYGVLGRGGVRARRLGIMSEPKGNGKTGLVAGLVLCHLLGPEAETRGEVYSAAIDRQQAALVFAECEAIIMQVPEFVSRVNVLTTWKKIMVLEGDGQGSLYEALSADARRAHGLSPSLFVYDELAQAKDRTLLDNLINGLGKRTEALGLIISTQAPDDYHPLSQLIDDGMSGRDPSTFVQLIAAPLDADIFDPEVWKACNPALGKFLSMKDMAESAERARRMPIFEPSFRNLRLNQRVETDVEARIVPLGVWQSMNAEPRPLDEQRGRRCFGALDLSGKHDLCCLVLVFPDSDEEDPVLDVYCWFWSPEGQLQARRPAERQLFEIWRREELVELTPGNVVRYGYVARTLVKVCQDFDVQAVGYDRWRIDDLKQELDDLGEPDTVPLEPFGQGFKDMGPAVDDLVEVAQSTRLRHGGHPVLTASMSAAVTTSDPAGNLKIDKRRANRSGAVRVDGAVCLAMAVRLAMRAEVDGKSVYDDANFVL